MTALERWQTGVKETVFQVRLTSAQEAKVRELSAKFRMGVVMAESVGYNVIMSEQKLPPELLAGLIY
jgi:hypothetical protein